MGHLFIQVVSTTVPEVEFGPDDGSELRQIWPRTSLNINWPAGRALTDRAADYVAASPSRMAGEASLLVSARP
jgi:hypothetical protein